MPHVVDYPRAFAADLRGERVAIIGAGGIGVDLAHLLSAPDASLTDGASGAEPADGASVDDAPPTSAAVGAAPEEAGAAAEAGEAFRSAYGLAWAGPVPPMPSPTRVTLICRGAGSARGSDAPPAGSGWTPCGGRASS